MTPDDFKAAWASASDQVMILMGQPVQYLGKTYTAIVDGLTYSVELRTKGGGLVEEFSGTIVFLKSDFNGPTGPIYPLIGKVINVPRPVSIRAIDGLLDLNDPFLTCLYEPILKK